MKRWLLRLRAQWRSICCTFIWTTALLACLFFPIQTLLKDRFQPLRELDDASLDIIMSWWTVNRDGPRPLSPMQLYNVDEATYRQWGSPLFMPREKVTQLIRRADHAGAAVIVVDIDLSHVSGENGPSRSDHELGSYLKDINERTDPNGPIVILVRSLRRPLGPDGQVENEAMFEVQPSFLDAYIEQERRVFWGPVLYSVDDGGIIRRHRLAELYCGKGQIGVMPSIPLLAAQAREVSLGGGGAERIAAAINRLRAQMANLLAAPPPCGKSADYSSLATMISRHPELVPEKEAVLRLSRDSTGPTVDLSNLPYADRIMYRLVPQRGRERTHLLDRSARDILDQPVSLKDASGELVLIGGSHADSGDLHQTPLGGDPMPGVYVLANAIDTLQQRGLLGPPSLSLALLFLAGANLVTVALFPQFKILGEGLLAIVLQLALLGFSAWMLDYGVGFVVGGIPLLLIQGIHKLREGKCRRIAGLLRRKRFLAHPALLYSRVCGRSEVK